MIDVGPDWGHDVVVTVALGLLLSQVIDVDPGTGDVVVVAVVLIQAAMITKSQSHKFNVSSLSRKQYQVGKTQYLVVLAIFSNQQGKA